MRPLALVALATLTASQAVAQEIDNVAAFARLYGVARWFYPSDAAASLDWNRFAVHGVSRVRAARSSAELESTLEELFAPLGPGIEIGARLPAKRPVGKPDSALVAWRYYGAGMGTRSRGPYMARRINRHVSDLQAARIPPDVRQFQTAVARPVDAFETPIVGTSIDVALALGLEARVPLALTDAEARSGSAKLNAGDSPTGKDDVDVRLADVVVAWNVFRHFYPYWSDLNVDWDARLKPQLRTALNAESTREAHLDVLRALVADAKDGHGGVRETAQPLRMGRLPLYFRILGEQLVVTASNDSAIPIGSVIRAIDGTAATNRMSKEIRLASGTPQWQRTRAESALLSCTLGIHVPMRIEPPTGALREVTVPCTLAAPAREARPDSLAELEPGIVYVDLTRVRATELATVQAMLARARAVVFDVRGYPTDIGYQLMPSLISAAEDSSDTWMHVSRIAGPFGQIAGWNSFSWNLQPTGVRMPAQRVFLTDGRAISYAESVMGYIRDHKLATIIGGTTAGANGNVADFAVPGGFSIAFTGMRVTRHDGKTPYHMVGVSPDIPLEPTLAGVRAGRDEVLLRAVTVVRGPQP
jgi:hypothetical protein